MNTEKIILEHIQKKTFTEEMIVAAHAARKVSPEFRAGEKELEADGNRKCWICGTTENIETHHFWVEFCEGNIVIFAMLEFLCSLLDIYGYSKKYKGRPFKSVDDIRQMMSLCKKHHTGKGTGIHLLDFCTWIAQKVGLLKANPVPQAGETEQQVMERISHV